MRRTLKPMALCALLLPVAVLTGCGGIPGNAIATVDGEPVARKDFDHWMAIAAKADNPKAKVPIPPDFKDCIAEYKSAAAKPAKGKPVTSDAEYKKQCATNYKNMKRNVVTQLLRDKRVKAEAKEQNVKVTDAEVNKEINKYKQSNPEFEKALKERNVTMDDVKFDVRLTLLQTKLSEKQTKGKDKVTDQQVKDYYEKNKKTFAQPETRDISVVLTKPADKAKATEAKAQLDAGTSFAKVAKKYSIDDQSKAQGGKLPGLQNNGQLEKGFQEAVFGSKKGKVVGPLKAQFGWYIIQVDKITPASQQTLAKATPMIKQTILQDRLGKIQSDYAADQSKRWREKTECRKEFVTEDCNNGPKPTPTPTPSIQTAPAQ